VFDKYHNYQEVHTSLKGFVSSNPKSAKLHTIAKSPGGNDITILQIGSGKKNVPAVFVGANFEGITPISTEGALYLADMIIKEKSSRELTWYILPHPNPDAAENFFSEVKYEKTTNHLKINNDVDDLTDEDGFDDLNGDGLITKMRVKDVTGSYIVSSKDPRIMKKADAKSGERGAYRIYTEGIDNDKDGQYNEDDIGGVNVGLNFPHQFNTYLKESGLWAGYTPEVYGIMEFIYAHPEIAMAFTLGTTNFCLAPPKDGRKGDANMNALKIPKRFADMLGADTGKTYTMDEVINMAKAVMSPDTEVTPSMIAGMLRLGATVNPLEDDLKFYEKYSEEYKEFLKKQEYNTERIDPEKAKDGSFELWAYYHLGIPSFSMNLFTIPKAEKEEKKDSLEIDKSQPKTEEKSALSEKDKALLNYIDNENGGNGFVNWSIYNHPTLGEVEIGGYTPFLTTTPPDSDIERLCSTQLSWLLKLSEDIPDIKFLDEKITAMGAGVYKVEITIENRSPLSYPIAIGERNREPAPIVIILEADMEMLQGKKRTPLGTIGGNQVKKLTWIVKAAKSAKIKASMESKGTGTDVKQILIGG
jgi:hypothetical protein